MVGKGLTSEINPPLPFPAIIILNFAKVKLYLEIF